MVQIRLFGDFEIVADDQPVPVIRSERRRALLAYLIAHHKTPQSRQSVAFTLWPQSSESQARTNLRKELHRLRKEQPAVEAILEIDTELLACRPTTTYQADVIEFEALLQRAASTTNPTLTAGYLGRAVALYQGDFFPQSYDNWVLATRERLRNDCISALDQLIDFHTDQEHFREALAYLRQLLQVDPLREETYRRMMQLHALNSDYGGVNHAFHRCQEVLAQEFGAEPSASTIELYRQLHCKQEPVPVSGPTALATSMPNPPVRTPSTLGTPSPDAVTSAASSPISGNANGPLIGRTAQWRQLEEGWQAVQRHQPRCILIRGAAGMGKTTLVRAFMAAVRADKGTAIYARTSPATHPPAYGPVIDWLRSGLFAVQLRALQSVWRAELAALLPELHEAMADLHTALGAATAGQQSHLLDALCALLQQVKRPLLIVLDDLQWSDMETLDWLQMVLTGAVAVPILILVTARTDELYTAPDIQLWALRLREAQCLHEMDLPLLSEAQTATFTNLLLETMPPHNLPPHNLPPHYRRDAITPNEVYRMTEGHPQMIEELVTALAQQPAHRRYPALPKTVSPGNQAAPPIALPKTDATIAVQLAQRSASAQSVLGMAAVIGQQVTLAQLLAVADNETAMLLDALDELIATGLLREERNGSYAFIHGRVRQMVQTQLSQARCRFYQQRLQQTVGFP